MSNYTPSEIALMIKEDRWKDVQEFDVRSFLKKVAPDEYVPNPKKFIQVKDKLIDWEFIEKTVTKIQTSNDFSGLTKGTVVYFPEGGEYEGMTILAGTFAVIGGSHGTVLSERVGVLKKEYNLINFKHDLDSNILKLRRLGNKLNDKFVQDQGLNNESIKLEFWALMDSRVERGEDAKPTRAEQDDFLKDYSQISQATLTNWMAHHKEGGRRAAAIQYTDTELDDFKVKLSNMECYKDYNILEPMVLGAWNDRAISRAVIESERGLNVKPLDARQGKKKVLVPLWAKSATDMQRLEKGDIQQTIEDKYNTWCRHMGFDALEATFVPWK